jgi:pimeloyl-ACP methyl ester carboxylesterase
MKRSRGGTRRSLSSNQWTLILLFLIILALIALILLSWLNRPSAPPAVLEESSTPTHTAEPTSTPRPTAVPPRAASPTLPPSPTPAVFYPTFTTADCRFTVPSAASLTCGVVSVPEDRETYPGRTVRLAVAIFHSTNPSNSGSQMLDPVLYLHDGPTSSAIHWAAINYDNFVVPITETRDLVVFDQRGSGLSVPNLDCTEAITVQKLDQRGRLSPDQKATAYSTVLGTCRERLDSHGIDPSKYTTRASATDARDIVRALGLEKVNLLGVAYGARLAQTILRDYPQEVNAVILDSPLPLDVKLHNEAAANYDRALNALFSHCAADPICNNTYPLLETSYENLVAELDSNPLLVTIPGDSGNPDYDIELDGLSLTRGLLSSLNNSYFISSLPKIITGFNQGDLESSLSFIQTALTLPNQPLLDLSSGLRLSIDCHEQVYATNPQDLQQAQEAFPRTSALGMETILGSTDTLFHLCDLWGSAPYDPDDRLPVQAGSPALVLAGQFDTRYPSDIASRLANDLPTGYYLEIPGTGHAPTFDRRSSCPISLALAFIDNPNQTPDTACLDSMAVTYYTSYTGEPPLELLPVVSEEMELQAAVPSGWIDGGKGIYSREAYYGDFTELQIQSSSTSAGEWLASLTDSFNGAGFDRTPARNTTRFANGVNWNIYRAFSENRPVELAFAETGERTLMVLLLSQTSERDALYRTVFLPAVDSTSLR